MRNNKGFSLVELIVVIAIMAILAAVAVASYSIYIQKAKDASDDAYKKNAEYAANLVATEHQFELVEVELEDFVDGPEDIKLIVKNSNGEEVDYTYDSHPDILKEIYDIIGNWTFSDACDHANCGVLENVPATCMQDGYIKYGCLKVVTIPQNDNHDFVSNKEPMPDGTVIAKCPNQNDDTGEVCGATRVFDDSVAPVG